MPPKKPDYRQTLNERNLKVSSLLQIADAHEDELKESMKQSSNFLDSKFTTVTKYDPIIPEEKTKHGGGAPAPAEPSTSAAANARKSAAGTEFSFSTVFETKDETKHKAVAKKGKAHPKATKSDPSSTTAYATAASSSAITTAASSALTLPGSSQKPSATSTDFSLASTTNTKSIIKRSSKISNIFRDGDTSLSISQQSSSVAESGFHHAVEALLTLENSSIIFMQRLLDYEEIQAAGIRFHEDTVDLAYQIINIQGTLVFLMEQHKVKCSEFIVYTKRLFENILYDVHGTVVLKIKGPSVIMSRMVSRMEVTDDKNRVLGYVKEFGKRVNYSVYNAKGERLFLVVSNVYIPSSSTVFSIVCQGVQIGVIKFGWKHEYHDLPYIDYETTGVEFPADIDEREKALLVGCMMLIEFSWYSPLTKLKLSMFIMGIILLTFGVLITLFPMFVEKATENKETASFYKVTSGNSRF